MLLRRVAQALLTVLCLLQAVQSHAQNASQASDTVYHILGTVRNSVTGKPIARALVVSQDRRLATMSDGEGRFALDVAVPPLPQTAGNPSGSISAGRAYARTTHVFLQTQRPDYLSPEQPVIVPLSDGAPTVELTLKLNPTANIAGHIYAPDTDSPSNVRVTLLRHQTSDAGHLAWQQTGARQTDSHGAFRFTGLRPGEYTVMTGEWAGDQPTVNLRAAARRTGTGIGTGNEPTQRYPPVFLGDAPDLDAAMKLHLRSGDTASAELHLHQATYYPVRIPVTGPPGANVSVRFYNNGSFNGFHLVYDNREQAITGALPNGHYNLLVATLGEPRAAAQIPLNVASAPVSLASVALSPARTIVVHVHADFSSTGSAYGSDSIRRRVATAPDPGSANLQSHLVQVYLRGDDTAGFFNATPAPKGEDALIIQNVQPGHYYVRAQPMQGYIASITSGGTDLADQPLTVGDNGSAEPIEIDLRNDGASLTGTLTNGTEPLPISTSILLLPLDSTAQYNQGFAGQDGKFNVSNIAPGSYRVLALSPMVGRQLPYREPEAMHGYESKGVTINATAGQQIQTTLNVLDSAVLDDL